MTICSSPFTRTPCLLFWRFYLSLLILQGLGALGLTFQSRSEIGVILGLSGTRALIVAVMLIILAFACWFLAESWLKPQICTRRINRLIDWLNKPGRWGYLTLIMGAFLLLGSYLLTLLPGLEEPFTRKFLERLAPLIIWFTGLSAQTLIALLSTRYGRNLLKPKPRGGFWITLVYFGGIFLAWIWAAQAVIPKVSELVGWNRLGAPIMEYQVAIAWGLGIFCLLLINLPHSLDQNLARLKNNLPQRVDLGIACLLWLSAVILWQSTPVSPNWFLSEKMPPNQEYYPYSDARNYDLVAQSALIGEGFKLFNGWDVRRPLHGAYLTILHMIAGQKYEAVITLQVLVLALLPVLIYFIVKSLHTRASGVVAAVLILLREANSIAITGNITTSNVKLLMVDLPVTLAVVFFAYLAIRWLKRIEENTLFALFSGGALGLSMLIRLETSVLALSPALIASLTLLPKKKYALWVKQLLLFLLGVALVISPWVWRNWQRTGMLFIDSPLFRYAIINQRFKPLTTPAPQLEQGTSEPVASTPFSTAIGQTQTPALPTPSATSAPFVLVTPAAPGQSWVQAAAQQNWREALTQPGDLVGFSLAHYLNSQIQTLLIFPTTYRAFDSTVAFLGRRNLSQYWTECCSLSSYTRSVPFWHKWMGVIPIQSILPILVTILIIATGIHAAWKKQKLVSLMPVLMLLIYLCFNALLRNSGGRYILPVDWVSIQFYSIGIIQLSIDVINSATGKKFMEDMPGIQGSTPAQLFKQKSLLSSPWFYGAIAGFFLIGCAIPLVEASFPERYSQAKKENLLNTVWGAPLLSAEVSQDLQVFLSQGGDVIAGRILYPQYFPPGYGSPDKDEGPLASKPYPRLVFNLTANYSQDMVLPVDKKPLRIPNASDALVFMCRSGRLLEGNPLAVAVFDADARLITVAIRSPFPINPSCPLSIVNGND